MTKVKRLIGVTTDMTLDFASAEITTADVIVSLNISAVSAVYVNDIIIRSHRSTTYVRPIVMEGVAWSVCRSVVGLSVCHDRESCKNG